MADLTQDMQDHSELHGRFRVGAAMPL